MGTKALQLAGPSFKFLDKPTFREDLMLRVFRWRIPGHHGLDTILTCLLHARNVENVGVVKWSLVDGIALQGHDDLVSEYCRKAELCWSRYGFRRRLSGLIVYLRNTKTIAKQYHNQS